MQKDNLGEKTKVLQNFLSNDREIDKVLFYHNFNSYPREEWDVNYIPTKSHSKLFELVEEEYNLEKIYNRSSIGGSDDEMLEAPLSQEEKDTDYYENSIYIDVKNKTLVICDYDTIHILSGKIVNANFKERVKKLHNELTNAISKTSVYILSYSGGFYLTDFEISKEYSDMDINEYYNDDIYAKYLEMVETLNEDKVGLYLLHGEPGTGKTSFIRNLIRKIDKRLIFIPPSLAARISDPDMIPFFMRYPNSILIIEDAENIITDRNNGGGQEVSNLLNLTDGIMGDCLKFQVICTFNTSRNNIDKALTRKGRLINEIKFDSLCAEKSDKLLTKLGKTPLGIESKLTNIFNGVDNKPEVKKVGFK